MKNRLVPALLAVALASCGAAKQHAAAPPMAPESSHAAPTEMPGDPRSQEIAKLSDKIEQQRTELALPEPAMVEPGPGAPATAMATVPLSTDASCKPAKTDRCESSCKISDSICNNASRICELAKDLADGWSAGKCARAKTTCESANEKCCSCQ